MELSIKRWNALLVVVIVAGGAYLYVKRGGQVPPLPPEVREVVPDLPGAAPAPAPAPPADDAPRRARRDPAAATPAPEPAAAAGEQARPAKRERTPDEKARSKVALAIGYAENGRFDLAYAALEEAEALGPGDDVKAEVAAATEQVTTLMRSRRR